MKITVLILCLNFGFALYAQSDSVEKAILYNKALSKEISPEQLNYIGMKWNEIIEEIGGYPELPLDNNGKIHFSFVQEFIGVAKEKLYSKTLEWLYINYELTSSQYYSNLTDGKIINRHKVLFFTNNSCNYTIAISIKSEKIKIDYFNIDYETYYPGYNSGQGWVAEKTIRFGINETYPVIEKKTNEWKSNLMLLKYTNDQLVNTTNDLFNYIINKDSDNDYGF